MTVIESLIQEHRGVLSLLSTASHEMRSSLGSRFYSVVGAVRLVRLHLRLVDQVMLPAITLTSEDAARLNRDHDVLREFLHKITSGLSRGNWQAVVTDLAALGAALEVHQSFEAERVYPALSQALQGPDAARIAERIAQERDPEVRELLDRDK